MDNKLHITDDGSHTMYNYRVGENYHSSHGAVQESKHIFINAGLESVDVNNKEQVNILEVGFGTGLNALLSYLWSNEKSIPVVYHGYEPYPITIEEALKLNYPGQLFVDQELFLLLHSSKNMLKNLSANFSLLINEELIENVVLPLNLYDVVFFDAFSPEVQPEMWNVDIFTNIYNSLKNEGVLTTYSCKGTVKRSLKESGFIIEKLPGPPGKREFLRAWKK